MCPLYPFHIILLYFCLLLPLLFAVVEGAEELIQGRLSFLPKRIEKLQEKNQTEVKLFSSDCPKLILTSDHRSIASINLLPDDRNDLTYHEKKIQDVDDVQEIVVINTSMQMGSNWTLTFNVSANFLGFARIKASCVGKKIKEAFLDISVARKKTIQSKLFSYSVALLISLAYINMGCAMDLKVVKETVKRPIGPIIGFISQFVLMPLIGFFLGFIFESAPMRLGLFVTGTSPGGGASNIWTLMFGGNLNLSLTMTTISTFSAFFMMPLWIFTLGQIIFKDGDIIIPYYKIVTYAFCLVIPLGIGLLISKYLPKLSKFLVKILKPMALFLILFIIIFGVWANLYIFKLMDWKVLLTGMALPWLGFCFGWAAAMLAARPYPDVIAIAIETGIQNTGMSIFILWFTLDHPLGDIAAVIPVAAATMTPIPLLFGLTVMKIREMCGRKKYVSGDLTNGVFNPNETSIANSSTTNSIVKLVPNQNGGRENGLGA